VPREEEDGSGQLKTLLQCKPQDLSHNVANLSGVLHSDCPASASALNPEMQCIMTTIRVQVRPSHKYSVFDAQCEVELILFCAVGDSFARLSQAGQLVGTH